MKRNMIALLGAALLVVVGCKKNDEATPNNVGEKMTFTATMGGGEKTFIDGVTGGMSWKDGDKITINGETFIAGDVTGNSATFTGPMMEPPYHAYYLATGNGATGTLSATQTYNVPVDGKADLSGVNPMYTESDDTNLHFYNICALVKLTLKGTASDCVQSIVVTADQPLSGDFEIATNADGHYYAQMNSAAGGDNTVTLTCNDVAFNNENGVDFYIALPQGIYGSIQFHVMESDESYWDYTAKKNDGNVTPLVAGKLYTTGMPTHYKESNGYKGVRLWADGPYWATCNVGAQNPWEYGDYYQWAEGTRADQDNWIDEWNDPYTIYDNHNENTNSSNWTPSFSGTIQTKKGFMEPNAPYYYSTNSYSKYTTSGTAKLEDCDDIAHLRWDGGWHIPDKDNFVALCANCYLEWGTLDGTGVAGIKAYVADEDHKGLFKTKTGAYKIFSGSSYSSYSGESVSPVQDAPVLFLPAAGRCYMTSRNGAGSNGYYWSRSLNSTNPRHACHLYFDSGNVDPANYSNRYYGRSVRPVL